MKLMDRLQVLTAATALIAGTAMVGCQQSSGPEHAMEEPISPNPSRPVMTPAAHTMTPSAENRMYYPTGEMDSSVLLLEKTGPSQVHLGKEYSYQIKVTNLTNAPLQGVTVQETLPGSFAVSNVATGSTAGAAAPAPQPSDHAAMATAPHTYSIGELGPKASRTITVSGTPSQPGTLSSCLSVSYSPTLCTTAMVTNPQMKILKEAVGAAGGDICQPQIIRYTLTNTGTGDLSGVRVDDPLPNGLTTESGANRVAFDVGTLAQGQSRIFEAKVKPHQGGQFASAATATADDGVSAKSEAAVLNVKAPKLEVTLKAPEKEYLGQQVKYEVTVKNVGDAPARTPMVRVDQAGETGTEGAQMAAAREGGQQVGELAPGASKTITVPLSARAEGDLKVNAIASDPCAGKAVMAAGQTIIAATPPGILLTTVDNPDPARVGENVTYTITVLNQGTTPNRSIKVVATLPDSEQYVSSSGATQGTLTGNKITFAPLDTLGGKQNAVWTVTVKALKPADVQFRADMSTESFPNAATNIVPTRLY